MLEAYLSVICASLILADMHGYYAQLSMVASYIDMISVIFTKGKLLKLHAPVSIHATSISAAGVLLPALLALSFVIVARLVAAGVFLLALFSFSFSLLLLLLPLPLLSLSLLLLLLLLPFLLLLLLLLFLLSPLSLICWGLLRSERQRQVVVSWMAK